MEYEKLTRASLDNGIWTEILGNWEAKCAEYSENFEDYASASMPVLDSLARETQKPSAGVFALKGDSGVDAICHANRAFLPGYHGQVLRIRHIVFAPQYDFDEKMEIKDYANTLIKVFVGSLRLSYEDLAAPHIKFHLKSPSERQFGEAFTEALGTAPAFSSVEMRGSWIYLSKA